MCFLFRLNVFNKFHILRTLYVYVAVACNRDRQRHFFCGAAVGRCENIDITAMLPQLICSFAPTSGYQQFFLSIQLAKNTFVNTCVAQAQASYIQTFHVFCSPMSTKNFHPFLGAGRGLENQGFLVKLRLRDLC